MMSRTLCVSTLFFSMVTFAFAQGGNTVPQLIDVLLGLLNRQIFPILTAAMVLIFTWAIIGWIRAETDQKAEKAKQVSFGLMALFVLLAMWGIVAFIGDTLGIEPGDGGNVNVPQFETSRVDNGPGLGYC